MNQPYSDSTLFWIVVANLISLAGLAMGFLIGVYRVIAPRVRLWRRNRWARRVARTVAARTDFDTALAHLAKDTDQ